MVWQLATWLCLKYALLIPGSELGIRYSLVQTTLPQDISCLIPVIQMAAQLVLPPRTLS